MQRMYRFKLELAGQTVHGLAFTTQAELEQFIDVRAMPSPPADPEPREPGRPSFDEQIANAVADLRPQLRGGRLSERARLVLKHIARSTTDSRAIPNLRTVERHLRQNSRQKSRQKSGRATIRRIGGA